VWRNLNERNMRSGSLCIPVCFGIETDDYFVAQAFQRISRLCIIGDEAEDRFGQLLKITQVCCYLKKICARSGAAKN
jgi:hypothetical protein